MKKIVPFNSVLTFNTDVCEITAISLEHDIKKTADAISGVFHISGEYKITDGQLNKDEFNFELPFDIALGVTYNLDTLVVDIDDFRYELIDGNKMKVNIDLYIDGEEIANPTIIEEETIPTSTEENREEEFHEEKAISEPERVEITENLDLLDEMLADKKEQEMPKENETTVKTENENNNINIFNAFNEEEKYVPYLVYRVNQNDAIDNILEKYNISKEELLKYNPSLEIHPGDKLIIPYNEK